MKFQQVAKMISADIKTDIKQEIKKLVAVSYNFSSQNYLFKTCGSMQPDIVHQYWGGWGK